MYQWMMFLHAFLVVSFMLVHGASAKAAFQLKRETNRERISAILDLSVLYMTGLHITLGLTLITGILMIFLGGMWNRVWIWLSLVLLLVLFTAMTMLAASYFTQLRKDAGLRYFDIIFPRPALPPASPEVLKVHLSAFKPWPVALIGGGVLLLVTWLMIFQPF